MKWLLAYGATAIVFAALDFVWLTTMGEAVYRPALQELMAAEVNYPAAVLFYVVYIGCVVFLAVRPAVQAGSLAVRARMGLSRRKLRSLAAELAELVG
jgi:uncharacterized membrane protein